MSLVSDVSFSVDSCELNESYDPIKEFEELLDLGGLKMPLSKMEQLWRKALYCRYQCQLINLDNDAPKNTWGEVARFVGWPDWNELRTYCIQKFMKLPVVDDAGNRDIID